MNRPRKSPQRAAERSGAPKWFYVVLAAVVVGGGGWLVLARRGGAANQLQTPISLAVTEVAADPAVGIAEGRPDAPVTLIEFEDFECPHCAAFNAFAGKLLRRNYVQGKALVRWIVYEYPLEHFENSIPAAIAARCARDQGRFWEMHDALFANQRDWAPARSPDKKFEQYAEQLGLDGGQFKRCLQERQHLSEIMAARKYGDNLGVNGTPTFFLNDRPVTVAPTYENMEKLILAAARESAAGGASGQEAVPGRAPTDSSSTTDRGE